MVSTPSAQQWSPSSWPVSLRWRISAAALVLAATIAVIFALSQGGETHPEVPVVAASQRWPKGHPPGEHSVISVPADLAPLFVGPAGLDGTVAAVDVPEGTLVSPQMLRSLQGDDGARITSLLRFTVNADMWPDPGPNAGSRAVFSPTPGGCAVALEPLVTVGEGGAGVLATLEATPELAGRLADGEWWIWESPPGGWPACEGDADAMPSAVARPGSAG